MSKTAGSGPDSVRVEDNSKYTGKDNSDYMFVNSAYVGSVSDVTQSRAQEPPTSVIREQYWACSKWPLGQRVLAIAVGVLLGAVISLSIIVAIRGDDKDIVNVLKSRAAPD